MSMHDEKQASGAFPSIQVGGLEYRWNLDRGAFTIGGIPCIAMFRDSSLAHMMQGFLRMVGPRRFALALRAEGVRSVEEDWAIVGAFPSFEQGFQELAKYAGTAGWGRWEIVELDRENKVGMFRIHGGWEGESQRAIGVSYGSGFFAGKLAGLCQRLFGVNCAPRQTMFIADGDPYDEFVIEPAERSLGAAMTGGRRSGMERQARAPTTSSSVGALRRRPAAPWSWSWS